jgi:hypothetical protein
MGPLFYFAADRAFTTGIFFNTIALGRHGKAKGRMLFADTVGTAEKVGVRDPIMGKFSPQNLHGTVLSYHIRKGHSVSRFCSS